MKKNVVKINEGILTRIVTESVKRVLKENEENENRAMAAAARFAQKGQIEIMELLINSRYQIDDMMKKKISDIINRICSMIRNAVDIRKHSDVGAIISRFYAIYNLWSPGARTPVGDPVGDKYMASEIKHICDDIKQMANEISERLGWRY